MVLKKPFAFLIKYFRIIHIALAVPLLYLVFRTGKIVHFFRDYINANYYTSISDIAGSHINFFMYLGVLLILTISIFIYFLMKKKEKSTKFYFFLIIFYIILFVMLGVTHSILSNMETQTMEATVSRAYRDISYIFYLPQYFFLAFTIFRGIGFDIKKFNFELDIKELEITDIDSEEFELNIGIEDYKIKRNIRRFIREMKYYILENKFIFTILLCIFIIIFGTVIYLNIGVYNKTYKQSQNLNHNNLNIQVTGSMLTNRDYSGKIFKDQKYYLVLKLTIQNRGREAKTLDYNNFFIQLDHRRVYPTLDRASYFIDYAQAIREDTELIPGTQESYVLAYELQENEMANQYKLRILEQISYKIGEIAPDYKNVTLKPYRAIDMEEVEKMDMGKIATFEESNIGYTSLQVKKYSIMDTYSYQYEYCYEPNKCRSLTDKVSANSSQGTLLILEATNEMDTSTLYYKSARTNRLFPEHFISVEYQDESGTYRIETENKTPLTFDKGYILQVTKDLEIAQKINLFITVRNKRYIIHLK